MTFYLKLLYLTAVIFYTAFIKLTLIVPVRAVFFAFLVFLLFLTHYRVTIDVLRRHSLTFAVVAAVIFIGCFLSLLHGRDITLVAEYILSVGVQPVLILLSTCVIARIAGYRFVVAVFVGSALLTGAVALLQFADVGAAWWIRDRLGDLQAAPSALEQAVEGRMRPMGLSLTPIILSYHLASAYILVNFLYRRGQMSGFAYSLLFLTIMAMSAANATRSLVLGIAIHEVLVNLTRVSLRSMVWIVVLVSIGVAGVLYLDNLGSRVTSFEDASAEGRLVLFFYGLYLAADFPFGLGWGFEPKEFAWLYWEHLAGFANPDGAYRLGIHNAYLNFFLTYGLFGVAIIASAVYIKPRKFAIFAYSSTAYLVNAMFHNNGPLLGETYFWFAFAIFLYFYRVQQPVLPLAGPLRAARGHPPPTPSGITAARPERA